MDLTEPVTTPFLVGKNAVNNWELLTQSHPNDLWFHVEKTSSAYVILHRDFIDTAHIIQAAQACKAHSKCKHYNKVKVIYCPTQNLKKGSLVGEALIRNHKKCKCIVV